MSWGQLLGQHKLCGDEDACMDSGNSGLFFFFLLFIDDYLEFSWIDFFCSEERCALNFKKGTSPNEACMSMYFFY